MKQIIFVATIEDYCGNTITREIVAPSLSEAMIIARTNLDKINEEELIFIVEK